MIREKVEDYGYPGRRRNAPEKPKTGYGLGDPDETVKTGHYGLDGHGAASSDNDAVAPAAETASAPVRRSKPLGARSSVFLLLYEQMTRIFSPGICRL